MRSAIPRFFDGNAGVGPRPKCCIISRWAIFRHRLTTICWASWSGLGGIVREFKTRTAENKAVAEWVLNHQFVRIHMKDVNDPPRYEGNIYIGLNSAENRYVAHWIDVFGGQFSETLGLGVRDGNSISFRFQYPDAILTNVFTYDPEQDSWISKIDQQDKAGEMTMFCIDTYSR